MLLNFFMSCGMLCSVLSDSICERWFSRYIFFIPCHFCEITIFCDPIELFALQISVHKWRATDKDEGVSEFSSDLRTLYLLAQEKEQKVLSSHVRWVC